MFYYLDSDELKEEARMLAARTGCRMIDALDDIENDQPVLIFRKNGISLFCGGMEMKGDLSSMLPRLKKNNLNRELLIKAAGKVHEEGASVIDATAGMGQDSLLLAAAGFHVYMFENDPVIAVLLRDSLRRASEIEELKQMIGRVKLIEGNSIQTMNSIFSSDIPAHINIIYLDPMFPERSKSGLVKKKFQILHYLEKPCENEEELLMSAIKAGPDKIIIKRPLKGKLLAGFTPTYSIRGKSVRYDCIVLKSLKK